MAPSPFSRVILSPSHAAPRLTGLLRHPGIVHEPQEGCQVLLDLVHEWLSYAAPSTSTLPFPVETNDQWIYKAVKDDVQVDIIFRSSGDMYLDDEMIQRIRSEEFQGHKVRVVAPEDLLVMKVVAHGEETFHYWHDALGLVARGDLDWDYLVWRARRHGTRRDRVPGGARRSGELAVIRIAAIGDLHFGSDSAGTYRRHLDHLRERADLLVLAGDLTRLGRVDEAVVLADELRGLPVPAVAVLGNHDVHSGEAHRVRGVLEDAGVTVLEEEGIVVEGPGGRVGIAGTMGFGGGFPGGSASDFGEPEMKAFVARTTRMAGRLEEALRGLDADVKVALLHYAPVKETLECTPSSRWPMGETRATRTMPSADP